MRTFDIIGGVVVAAWLVAVAAFVVDQSRGTREIGAAAFELQEGVHFINLQQGTEDRGVIREERTRLVEGWLVETSAYATFEMMGQPQAMHLESRVSLDEELRLQSASGEVQAFGMHLRALAQHTGDSFDVTLYLDGEQERFELPFNEAPQLVGHAIPRLLASQELESGESYSQSFVDPMTLAPTELTLRYVGPETIQHFGETVDVHRFVQSIGTHYLDVLVDSRGDVVQQGFPFRILGSRLPQALGTTYFRRAQQAFEEAPGERPDFLKGIDPGDLLTMASHLGGGQVQALTGADQVSTLDLREVGLRELGDRSGLTLESPRQRVMLETDDELVVQLGPLNPHWMAPDPTERPSETLPEFATPRPAPDVVTALDALSDALGSDPPAAGATALADLCALRDGATSQRWPTPDQNPDAPALTDLHNAILTAEIAIPAPTPAACLATAHLAMTRAGHHPRLVHGLVFGPHGFLGPRIWLVGTRQGQRYELDPLHPAPLAADHLQLFISERLEPLRLHTLFTRARVEGG
ncbi:hypothetical protein DL240_04725 [Lujinxingia litoralis]|uniref:Transglutaminase-like domain-containing protein n=1 Tax=Lujinxingia litoralis TaxID=2211119 RepID=A0A328CBW4_9DELT|nr:hypothetical protein [Lujinxingia litoralis]RAL25518.1 hypothetical protein DL240_04725 [Lujinxingia litoralis]